jgi:hypothetical protein
MACHGHPSTSYRRSSIDAMAGASTSIDGLFIHNSGSLASFVGRRHDEWGHGAAACRSSGAVTCKFCCKGRHRVLSLFVNSQAPLSSSILLVGARSDGQRGMEGQRRMAIGIVYREWCDEVIPFLFSHSNPRCVGFLVSKGPTNARHDI